MTAATENDKAFILWAREQGAVSVRIGEVAVSFATAATKQVPIDDTPSRQLPKSAEQLEFDAYIRSRFGVSADDLFAGGA
jgi:hypothetical protein